MKEIQEVRYGFRIIGASNEVQALFREKFSKKTAYKLSIRPHFREQKKIVVTVDVGSPARLKAVASVLRAAKIHGKRCELFVSLNSNIQSSIIVLDHRALEFIRNLGGSVLFSYTVS